MSKSHKLSKSHNKTKSLKLNVNIRKKNKLIVNKYSKKMCIFYKPILQILEKQPKIAQYFSIKENSIIHKFLNHNKYINYLSLFDHLYYNINLFHLFFS